MKAGKDYYKYFRSHSQLEIEERMSVKWKYTWKLFSLQQSLSTQKFFRDSTTK